MRKWDLAFQVTCLRHDNRKRSQSEHLALLTSELQKPRLLKSCSEVCWVFCRLLGTKTTGKHRQRKENHGTSPPEALRGFGRHFERVDFLCGPLRHCLFISLFPVALTRQESSSSECPGLPVVDCPQFSLTPLKRFCTHGAALCENDLNIMEPPAARATQWSTI